MNSQSPVADQVEVGVVGAGHISSTAHLPILSNIENVEIKYITDLDKTRMSRLSNVYNAKSISPNADLPPCDIALISTPIHARKKFIEHLGKRGTAIFCEKPFAKDTTQHKEFAHSVNKIYCNYTRLSFGRIKQLRYILTNELFGTPNLIRVGQGGVAGATGQSKDSFRNDAGLKNGGMLMEAGVHTLSELVYLFGGENISVDSAKIITNSGFDIDDSIRLTASHNGCEIPIQFDLSRIRNTHPGYEIEFDDNQVTVGLDPDDQIHIGQKSAETTLSVELKKEGARSFGEAIYLKWIEFLNYLEGDADPPVKTGYHVTRIIENIINEAEVIEQ